MIRTYNARTVSSNVNFHALLDAAGRIKFHVIAQQETKTKKEDVRQMKDRTLIIRGEKLPGRTSAALGLSYAHQSSILSTYIKSTALSYPPPPPSTLEDHQYNECYSPTSAADERELDAFYEKLEEAIHNEKSFYKFVVGDFNARIRMAEEASQDRIGRFRL